MCIITFFALWVGFSVFVRKRFSGSAVHRSTRTLVFDLTKVLNKMVLIFHQKNFVNSTGNDLSQEAVSEMHQTHTHMHTYIQGNTTM